jgi:putative MFS transporter
MNVHEPQRVSAASRLDRLPIFSFHRHMMWLLSFCFFFELADINIFSFSAPAIRAQWGISIGTIGISSAPSSLGARDRRSLPGPPAQWTP